MIPYSDMLFAYDRPIDPPARDVLSMTRSSPQEPRQGRNDALAVLLVIIDVRRGTHAAKARGDMDAVSCEALDEPCRHPVRKTQAQDMRRAEARVGYAEATAAQARRDPLRQHQQTLCNGCRAPVGHHLH